MGRLNPNLLRDALGDVERLFFDTAPLINFIERHDRYGSLVRDIVRLIDRETLAGVTSVITLTEVLTHPRQLGRADLEQRYESVLLKSRHFETLPIDAVMAERAADLRARYRLRTPDALQMAVALQAGCEAFLTNDAKLRRVTDLKVLVLDDLAT